MTDAGHGECGEGLCSGAGGGGAPRIGNEEVVNMPVMVNIFTEGSDIPPCYPRLAGTGQGIIGTR
ncbi:hypothetical protein LCGC14_2731580 [marine sediment metagenome]|uniref:Uncharacterized protein n=1 Tax=marine sediment metagenome TaxID=412755 RepID=A0A0F9BYU7_9ZZZZ